MARKLRTLPVAQSPNLARLSGRERRFQKWLNHTISRQLVDEAKATNSALAFEDLTGIRQRAKVRGPLQRRKHHNWAFYQLRTFVTYKAVIAGVPVIPIDPRYTSQTCPAILILVLLYYFWGYEAPLFDTEQTKE